MQTNPVVLGVAVADIIESEVDSNYYDLSNVEKSYLLSRLAVDKLNNFLEISKNTISDHVSDLISFQQLAIHHPRAVNNQKTIREKDTWKGYVL